jgi:hypothetical protein
MERKTLMKQSLNDVKLEIEKLLFKYQQSNDFEKFRSMDVLDEGYGLLLLSINFPICKFLFSVSFGSKSEQTVAELSRLHDLIKNHKKMNEELYSSQAAASDELFSASTSTFNPHLSFDDNRKYLETMFRDAQRIRVMSPVFYSHSKIDKNF